MRGCIVNSLILEPPRCGYECYAMLPRGAVVVGAMVWNQEWDPLPSDKNLGLHACAGLKLQ